MTDLMEQAQETFINESLELLQEMEQALNQLESEPGDSEAINSLFRAAHTIKGSAGLFGFDKIVGFTHIVENLLEQVRAGDIALTGPMIDLLLRCRDHTERLIELISCEDEAEISTADNQSQQLVTALQGFGGESDSSESQTPVSEIQAPVERMVAGGVENENWHISLRLHSEALRDGLDPLSFLRYLSKLGTITCVETLVNKLPLPAEIDPELCYLGFELALQSDTDKQTLMDVFEFLSEESQVLILPPHSKLEEYAELIEQMTEAEADIPIGEILLRCGALTEQELAAALNQQAETGVEESAATTQPLGQILVEKQSIEPQTLSTGLSNQNKARERKQKENRSIRIDAERLDQLINLVGELVIAGAGTSLLAHRLQDAELVESSELTSRLVEEIRDLSLSLRMIPIGETFNRFTRVVRDVSRELDKDIKLIIEGADTELDKSVVEKIGDPLTHLVRNSIDHGIESPEERQRQGKNPQGTVKLDAYHDSGSIVIEVSDDGGGIDPEKVFRKAVSNGLVTPDQKLSEQDCYRLILEPGFSTKEEVSSLSGRGVGMDVVKRNLETLRGSIEVDSELGKGTAMRIRLPLTLSIIDGFLVSVGSSTYVIPLNAVVECIEYTDADSHFSQNGDYINLRGEILPYLNLRNLFQECESDSARKNIIVVQCGKQKAGLVVDELLGEYQTVIKPLSKIFSGLSGISGSTILGSGEVAMILDVVALITQAEHRHAVNH